MIDHLYYHSESKKVYLSSVKSVAINKSHWEEIITPEDFILLIVNKSLMPEDLLALRDFKNHKQCIVLANEQEEKGLCSRHKIYSLYMNFNAFLDYDEYNITNDKQHDAVIDPDMSRIELASNILQSKEYQTAKCGVVTSLIDGACPISSKYLLSGMPVISTASVGGRHIWYDESNSIISDETPESVEESVKECIEKIDSGFFNPESIRKKHITGSTFFRNKFVKMTELLLKISSKECYETLNNNLKALSIFASQNQTFCSSDNV